MTDSSNGPQAARSDQLERIRQQLDDSEVSVADVSRVLAEAVRVRSAQDDSLGQALGPTIVEALHSSIKQEPRPLVEAIAPVMGPAIRRSILQTIRGMVQSLNRTMEHSLSPRGLKWRIEAFRTGKTFGEIVFLHTLVYQVEHLFLIHRETGLLLQHVGIESAEVQDTDLVSGMLTAIQAAIEDFVHDSFGGYDTLDTMRLQEQTVWIEAGSAAVLAVVIRGEAPEELRGEIQETLEKVHIEHKKELDAFKGDTTPFERSRPELERRLQVQFQENETAKSPVKAIALIGLAAVAILCALGYWIFLGVREQRRWDAYVQQLQAEPGIVVTTAEKRRGKYHISGLRDPLALSPQSLLAETEFDPRDVIARWESYHSSEPSLVRQRLERLLSPPTSVKLELEDGVLRMTGQATRDWIASAGKVALSVPGVATVEADDLRDVDAAWRNFLEKLNAEPGIVVTGHASRGGKYHVSGLRDPLAREPEQILSETQLAPSRIVTRWETFHSPDPRFVLPRAEQVLEPPPGVQLSVTEGVLRLSGTASEVWIAHAAALAPSIPGVSRIDQGELRNADQPWHDYLAQLEAEPGIIVTDAGKQDGKYFVTGLREPLARNPLEIQQEYKLESVTVIERWEPYQSAAPRFALARAKRQLNPPSTVTIELDQGVLKVSGAAGHAWITQSAPLARSVPGVVKVDATQLTDLDAQRLAELTRDVQQHVVYFEGGASAMLDAEADLQQLADSLQYLFDAADAADRQVEIRIVGHAARRGSDERQQQLSQARAEAVRTALVARSVPAERLTTSAAGATQPARTGDATEDLAANRRVTFEVSNESKP
jgi:outer membrane protein OmpA-like peptidoglycan-associated protein